MIRDGSLILSLLKQPPLLVISASLATCICIRIISQHAARTGKLSCCSLRWMHASLGPGAGSVSRIFARHVPLAAVCILARENTTRRASLPFTSPSLYYKGHNQLCFGPMDKASVLI